MEDNRELPYLQALVEQKEIPFLNAQGEPVPLNTHQVQAMDYSDGRGLVVVTVPNLAQQAEVSTRNCEGYSLVRLATEQP